MTTSRGASNDGAEQAAVRRLKNRRLVTWLLGTWMSVVALGIGALVAPPAVGQGFPPEVDLADLLAANGGTGAQGFVLNGAAATSQAGFSVAPIGDLNGDNVDDFVIGAPEADFNGFNSGQVYVIFGRPSGFPPDLELSSLLAANGGDGTAGFVLNGSHADFAGYSVAGAGDVNGDGRADLLIGAWFANPNGSDSGQSYIIFGRTTAFPAEFELSSLLLANGGDGTEGFALNGVSAFDAAGNSVASAGDVNGDGIDDVLIGAKFAAPTGANSGQSYVVYGRLTGFPAEFELSSLLAANGGDGTQGFALNGIAAEDRSGTSVASAGDVNGDGIDDVIIGAMFAEGNGIDSGQAYVVFGRTTGFPAEFELSSLLTANGGNGSQGFALHGAFPNHNAGETVASAGDINADGTADLLVATQWASTFAQYAGKVSVVFGRTTGFPAELSLRDLLASWGGDGTAGFVINAVAGSDYAGTSAAPAGDVNDDGISDLIVGARGADPNGSSSGQSYVVFGRATGFPAEWSLGSLLAANGGDGSQGFALHGIAAGDGSGGSNASAGDVNGDGVTDVLIGARYADPNGASSGQAYVVYGGPPQDSTPPVVTPPAPATVAAVDATGTPATDPTIQAFLAAASAADNVDGDVSGSITNDAPAQFPLGTTTVTFSVTDAAGNTGTAQSTVTVADQGIPVLVLPGPITVAAVDGTGTPGTDSVIQTFLAGATAVDDVDGDLTASITNDAPAQFPVGSTTVIFAVSDAAGNTGTASSTVTVADQAVPVVVPPAPITVAAIDGTGTPATNPVIEAFLAGATASDNVDGDLTASVTNNAPGQFPLGVTTVTFSVTDAAGNTGTADATVTVTDQAAPVVIAPAATTVAAIDATGTAATDAAIVAFLAAATATDNVDGDVTGSVTQNAPAQFPLGATTVTFSVTDAAGNTGTAQSTVTVADQTAPVVTAPAPIVVAAIDATGTPGTDAAIAAFLVAATAADNVDGDVTGSITQNAPAQFPLGVTTVTFSVTDAAGNTGTANATVTVSDQAAPMVTAPAAITVAAIDAAGTAATDAAIVAFLAGATATDNVDGDITSDIISDAPAQFPLGATTVTFSVTDAAGNTGTADATVTVTDQAAPVVTAPGAITVAAVNANGTPASAAVIQAFLIAATATDNVDGDVTGSVTQNAPAQFPLGATTVTFSVTDAAGNTDTADAIVTIADQAVPVVIAPAAIVVAAIDATGTAATDAVIAAFLVAATAADNVDGDVTGSVTQNAPAQFPLGATTVTFSVTDAAGNTGTADAIVTIADQAAPVVTAPAAITVAAIDATGTAATDAAIVAFLAAATATDNVDGDVTGNVTQNAPGQFPLGATLVTFSVTDAAGNTGTADAIVTIVDQTVPVVTAPAAITVGAIDATGTAATDAAIVAFLAAATATDNVDGDVTGSVTQNAPAQFPLGATTVTFSATDVAGNTGTANATVTVTDQAAPVVTAPAAITVAAVDGAGTAATDAAIVAFLAAATATDNVDGDVTGNVTQNAPPQFALGETTVTFSVTDAAGNTGMADAIVTVTDQAAPVVTAPAPISVAAIDATGTAATDAAIVAFLAAATATDNVDGDVTGSVTQNAPGQFPLGATTVMLSVTDAAGNTGTADATVTVADQTAPALTAPNPITVAAVASTGTSVGDPLIQAFLAGAMATDNVDGDLTSAITNNGPAQYPHGTTPVMFTVADAAGNPANVVSSVTVVGPKIERGVVSGVTNTGWTTVNLGHAYNSMVVLGTANYDDSTVPLVVRMQEVSPTSFQVRVDRTDGSQAAVAGVDVHYLVVEEGVYAQAMHGVKMEAVKFTSTVTDRKRSWGGTSRSYAQSYTSPVVLGQVMSYNDADFSAFWSRGSSRSAPPSSTTLRVGKHVGEDSDTTRANETIGYLVIEAGTGTIEGIGYTAQLGSDAIRGVGNTPPYGYGVSGISTASAAIVSQAAMDGGNGGWSILYGPTPVTVSVLNLAIDEDQAKDSERNHTPEQVGYIILE